MGPYKGYVGLHSGSILGTWRCSLYFLSQQENFKLFWLPRLVPMKKFLFSIPWWLESRVSMGFEVPCGLIYSRFRICISKGIWSWPQELAIMWSKLPNRNSAWAGRRQVFRVAAVGASM